MWLIATIVSTSAALQILCDKYLCPVCVVVILKPKDLNGNGQTPGHWCVIPLIAVVKPNWKQLGEHELLPGTYPCIAVVSKLLPQVSLRA